MVTVSKAPAGLRLKSLRKTTRLFERMKGLLGTDTLAEGAALWISPCGSVHTIGMRYNLDLFFLDRSEQLVRVVRDVPPGRFCVCGGLRAYSVIEAKAGWLSE